MRMRIVRDKYLGYEVQVKRWWWPFWVQADYTNTFRTIAQAESWGRNWAEHGNTVKEIDL